MSLPPSGTNTAPADPFGLWSLSAPQAALPDEVTSFDVLAGGGAGELDESQVPVWQLDMDSGPEGEIAAWQHLEYKAGQVQGIFDGLEQAVPRSEALLDARSAAINSAAAGDDLSYSLEVTSQPLPEPEAWLSGLLDKVQIADEASVDASSTREAGEDASFGLGQDLATLAGRLTGKPAEPLPVPGWEDLQRSFDQMMDSINRQLLHFCYVDTTLDGQRVARTIINWGGDMMTLWKDGLLPEQAAAHRRSLELAVQSREANLKTIMTVVQVAGRLILTVTTPLGPLQLAQALVLAWKFVSSVVTPLLEQA